MSRRPGRDAWEETPEAGSVTLMYAVWLGLKFLGRRVLLPVVRLVTLYFFLFNRRGRDASRDYLLRVAAWAPELGLRADWRTSLAHFNAFGDSLLDRLEVWAGRIGVADLDFQDESRARALRDSRQGLLLIGSHLGNLEILRALSEITSRVTVNVLVHTAHARKFNAVLERAGATGVRLIEVTELDPATLLRLRECLARGEWVAIVGDRVPVGGGRTVSVDFMGGRAALPQGPYLLALLLHCPSYLVFCLRRGRRYEVAVEPFAPALEPPRGQRDAVVRELAGRYAERLAHQVRRAPLQWFNFYRFWEA